MKINTIEASTMKLPYAEPFKIKTVEAIHQSNRKQREKWVKDAKYNLFRLQSNQIYIDLLTDSGTGAMSDKQWSEIMQGDESYAGSQSFAKLKQAIREIFDFEYFLPVHQGRAAENVLFSSLIQEGDRIPGNSHFDTTKGHIEFRRATAVDCSIDEAFDTTVNHPFKGNVDCEKLERVYQEYTCKKIPFSIITITCNTSGGQPVSMQNIKEVAELSKQYDIPLFFDAARFAENAYFIKTREPEYKEISIREIVREMFSYVDGFTMSCKKDAIVNIGGLIGVRSKELFDKAGTYNILFEGYVTYGGLAGRDLAAIARGLYETTDFEYLQSRIKQVHKLANRLLEFDIPVQQPVGGHAVFVDVKRFLPHIPQKEFSAQLLAIELYLEAGVRSAEIGTLQADRDPVTRQNRYPKLELLRLAIPRRVYTDNQLFYVAVALHNIYNRRKSIKHGLAIVNEAQIMRHFTIELKRI